MSVLRKLLAFPLTLLYGSVLRLRHWSYDAGLLRSVRPAIPTIAIGNLSFGGTGKTPVLELVLRILTGHGPVATLSRGYGRTDTEIREVSATDPVQLVGDEPLQVKSNFKEVRVFVGADRIRAIDHIMEHVPDVKAVILDDALQHRPLNAGLNILLTTWQRPFSDDALFPGGGLRDIPQRAKAAQVVVVTKCPELPDPRAQEHWRNRLGLSTDQDLFFAGIEYAEPVPFADHDPDHTSSASGMESLISPDPAILLFTGIADPGRLVEYMGSRHTRLEHVAFPDHHPFRSGDLQRLAGLFSKFAPGPKMLVTTEKDAMRLRSVLAGSPLDGLPLAVIGMRAVILNEPERFSALIQHHAEPN